jgi:hypothetical protein
VHQAYIQQKEDGAEARQRLADAVQSTRLNGGVMFKCRETRCYDELLQIRRGIEQKKQDAKEAKMQKKIVKETEKDRRKRAGDADAVRKHIITFNKRQDKIRSAR